MWFFHKKKVVVPPVPHTVNLPDYAGIAVRYILEENPYFQMIVSEALKKIADTPAGAKMLVKIGLARPTFRSDFPMGINVIVVPAGDNTFVQSGYKRVWAGSSGTDRTLEASTLKAVNLTGRRFYWAGKGSCNAGVSPADGEKEGQGTVCMMYFSGAQIITSKGENTYPYIVLAHELIHSYHNLYGRKHPKDEENKTTGLGIWAGEEITENRIREQSGLPLRTSYY